MTASSNRTPDSDLRAVLDNMTDVFFRTDRAGRLVMASRSIETLLGWPRDEILNRDVRIFYVDALSRQTMIEAVDGNGGRISGHDLLLRRRDGGTVWVSISARRLGEDEGGGLEGMLHDVSDRRLAEARLSERRTLVQTLLNATTDATMLIDAAGTLLACNKVFADRLDAGVDDLVGRDLFTLFPPDIAERRRAACAEAAASGQTVALRDMRAGRHLLNTVTPVPNPGGTPWLAIFSRDVTQEVADKASIEAHMATIRRSNEELEQFAYVASHDLREPLRQISSYIGLLERRYLDRLDGEAREFMAYIRNGAQRLDALILDLLAFSRVTRAEAAMTAVPLHSAIDAALALHHDDLTALTIEVPPAITVRGDENQLVRLFQNLIGNALKYRAAERPPRVQVRARVDGAMVEVAVTDNGIGIEAQHFDRIFRIFQRLHGAGKYDGTGIGLAIVKRVVENHGGTIAVASTPGEGSTFTVRLPLA
ncbi:MAG: sensor histidine kinase [Bacteroidales bacterium]